MNATVISHVYNEEYLIPWWLEHHKKIFDQGIIIDYDSTDRTVAIVREICPDWIVVKSRNKYFGALDVDSEVMCIEKMISGWKVALNVTEFFIHNDEFIKEMECKNQIFLPSLTMIDSPEQFMTQPDKNKPLVDQRYHGVPVLNVPILDRAHHARSMHNINIQYSGGRHYPISNYRWIDPPKIECYPTNNALILWYGYCPMNNDMLKRKCQIKYRIPQSDIDKGAGYHHFLSEESFKATVQLRAFPHVRSYKDEIAKYYRFES